MKFKIGKNNIVEVTKKGYRRIFERLTEYKKNCGVFRLCDELE